jgi:hypothetical protein
VSRRVLIVAYYFPPLGGAGALRALSFARHLPDHGWEPVVITPRDGAYLRDPALRFPEGRVVRTGSIELSRIGKRALRAGGSDTHVADVTGVKRMLRDAARSAVYFPDAQIGWYPPAVRRGRTIRADAVLSTSFPITGHLVGRRLARSAEVPWVADFRDPWSALLEDRGEPSRRADSLERRLALSAARVIHTSPSWARWHGERWGRDVDVVLNGHDLSEVTPADTVADRRITYVGTYYPRSQDLGAVWDAAAALGGWSVRIVGPLHPEMAAALERRGIPFESTEFLGRAGVVEELRGAGVLLAPGPRDASGIHGGHIASKVFEYLATDRPVLYVGDPAADMADLIRPYPGTYLVAAGDVDAARRALLRSNGERFARDSRGLTREAQVERVAALLDAAVAG